jgi:hypothetical protein
VIANGGTATCTVTNDDQPGKLIVKKTVINNNGGMLDPEDFSFKVDGGTPIPFEHDGQNDITVNAGTHFVVEVPVGGYTTTTDGCLEMNVPNGGSATCTITNDDFNLVKEGKITKSAVASTVNSYSWTIDKVGDKTDLTILTGQSANVNYQVTGSPTRSQAITARGVITIENPYPEGLLVETVTDTLSGDIPAVVTCTLPHTIPAFGTFTCDYTATLPNGDPRTNTAKVKTNGYENIVPSEPLPVVFEPPTDVGECITINDDRYIGVGEPWTVCAGDPTRTVSYTMTLGPYPTCGDVQFKNIASFVAIDTGATGSKSWTVTIHVTGCGCTLTQGYWKTHTMTEGGVKKYDDTWNLVGPKGENEIFFKSGQTWYQVLNNPGKGGNVYYILAKQYIAARLNQLAGAGSTPEVTEALNWAQTRFFEIYTPAQAGDLKKFDKKIRDKATAIASLLDRYNNGLIGPGHCKE